MAIRQTHYPTRTIGVLLLAVGLCLSDVVWLLARTETVDTAAVVANADVSSVPGWLRAYPSPVELGKIDTTPPTPFSRLAHRLVAGRQAQSKATILRRAAVLPAVPQRIFLHRKIAPVSASDDPLLNSWLASRFEA
jgi:hypothetical protein